MIAYNTKHLDVQVCPTVRSLTFQTLVSIVKSSDGFGRNYIWPREQKSLCMLIWTVDT